MASMLKKTNVNLELLTDVDMLLIIQAGTREVEYVNQHIDILKQIINT